MILFETATCDAVEAGPDDIPAMQRFYEANPAYTRMVEGRPVAPDAATVEFFDLPPPELPYTGKRWLLVRSRASAEVLGLIDVVEGLLAPPIWHVGLFFIAESAQGTGLAAALHAGLQAWAMRGGARWLRLGVVDRNERGARFWRRHGYRFVCSRQVGAAGGRSNTVWCLVKPLDDDNDDTALDAYFTAQSRDSRQAEPAAWQALSAGFDSR